MHLGIGGIGVGFVAGVLSVLSPCVLPVLPLVLTPAASGTRLGLLGLGAGLVSAFVGVGLFLATIGFSLGLDAGLFREASAVLLAGAGLLLSVGALERRFAVAAGRLGNPASARIARVVGSGVASQFAIGLLLGAVWSPCVGPTLGAAALLAAQGRDVPAVASVMVAFGLGTTATLLLLGLASREAMLRWRGRLLGAGATGKRLLGVSLVLVAALILTGADRRLETALVAASPAWLTSLTTKF